MRYVGARALVAASLIVAAQPLHAADPELQSASFTGCHVGIHGGGVFSTADEWTPVTPGGAFIGQSLGSHDLSGAAGGVQGGCDYAFASGLVLGFGAGYTLTNARGEHASTRETGVSYLSKTDGIGTATVRAGFAWDRVLGFVSAGIAAQQDKYWATTTVLGTAFEARETRLGWTVGAGAEVQLTHGLSAFARYDYADFGTDRIGLTPQVQGLRPASVEITSHTSLLRAGINLRFGGPGTAR